MYAEGKPNFTPAIKPFKTVGLNVFNGPNGLISNQLGTANFERFAFQTGPFGPSRALPVWSLYQSN